MDYLLRDEFIQKFSRHERREQELDAADFKNNAELIMKIADAMYVARERDAMWVNPPMMQ